MILKRGSLFQVRDSLDKYRSVRKHLLRQVSGCVFPTEGKTSERDISGRSPSLLSFSHCSPCGQITCPSLTLLFHGVGAGKTDAKSRCVEEENFKFSSSYYQQFNSFGGRIPKYSSNTVSLFLAITWHRSAP